MFNFRVVAKRLAPFLKVTPWHIENIHFAHSPSSAILHVSALHMKRQYHVGGLVSC